MIARRKYTRADEGFTMVELLVAVSLSVLLVCVLTMAFQVATSTVETVQRKLDIYEAARGVLQVMAMAIQPAALNQRGEYFIVKSVAYEDNDDRTPADDEWAFMQLVARRDIPDGPPMDVTKYDFSRRECDCLAYVQSTIGRSDGGGATMPYAAHSPYSSGYKLERFAHSALFRDQVNLGRAMEDVVSLEVLPYGYYFNMPYETLYGADINGDGKEEPYTYQYYECEEFEMRPGRDYTGTSVNARQGRGRANVRTMDFNVSFWHEGLSSFIDPPDYTVVALSPMPKAIKLTVNIWDYDGRDHETFSRIVWLPGGLGATQLVGDTVMASYGPGAMPWLEATDPAVVEYGTHCDADWAAATVARGRPDDPGTGRSAYFNRYKQIIGDPSWNYAVNWNLVNYYNDPPTDW